MPIVHLLLSCSLKVKFLRDGKEYMAYGKKGDTLLDMIINNELDFDGFGNFDWAL